MKQQFALNGRRNFARRVRRYLTLTISIMLCVCLTSGNAYGAEITQRNIDAGLAFCAEYPVGLTYEGEPIIFSEKDVPPVIITPDGEENGRTLIPARALFEKMGGQVTWDGEAGKVEITLNETQVQLFIGLDTAFVNDEAYILDVPPLIIDHDHDYYGSTMIPVRFVAEALDFQVNWVDESRTVAVVIPEPEIGGGAQEPSGENGEGSGSETEEPSGGGTVSGDPYGVGFPTYEMPALPKATKAAGAKLIALDFGHGGTDVGAIANQGKADQLYEKDLNRVVGLALAEKLRDAGMNIYVLKEGDTYMDKYERAALANAKNADFFVSVHNNSSEYANPNGTEVLYYAKLNAEGFGETALYGINSGFVAQKIQAEMVKALGTADRGISNKPSMAVLNKTDMPAIIIEGAFISNAADFAKIKTPQYVERYSYAAAKAIIEAFNEKFPDSI